MTDCTYVVMSEFNITECQQFIHVFQVSFLRLISLEYWLCFADFSLGLHYLMFLYIYGSRSRWKEKPMLLKRKLHEPLDFITNVIYPYTWLMAWQWRHFMLASNTSQVRPIALNGILSREFEEWCKYSSRVKRELHVFYTCIFASYLPYCYLYDRVIPCSAFLLEKLLVA